MKIRIYFTCSIYKWTIHNIFSWENNAIIEYSENDMKNFEIFTKLATFFIHQICI